MPDWVNIYKVMKTSKTHSKYLKKIAKAINSLLKKPVQEFEKEDYHKLRVGIKKLNALLDSVKFCSKNFKRKKYFKAFKKIFRQSGKIRESQLEESTLKKYEQYYIDHYLSDLENRIRKEQKKFASITDNELRKKINKSFRKIEPFINKMYEQKVDEFMKNERNKINNLIQQKYLKPDQVHELRKRLKIDFYNRKSLGLPDPDNTIKEEDDFLELLGKWHDCRIMNNQLEKSITEKGVDPTELIQLLKIDAEILLDAENLFKEINTSLATKSLVASAQPSPG